MHRTEQSFQACNDIVACFMERAKVEKQYAQQLSQWSSKWKSIVDSRKCEKLKNEEQPWSLQSVSNISALIELKYHVDF